MPPASARRRARAGWALILWLCACAADRDGALNATLSELKARTAPPGTRVVAESSITRDTWSAATTWTVETSLTWEDYCQRVGDRLFGFTSERTTPQSVFFTQTLSGDTHTLLIEATAVGPPLRVRVTFRAVAS